MKILIILITGIYGYIGFRVFSRKPEYMVYFLILFMLTSFHNALPSIYLFPLSIWIEMLCAVIMAGLYLKGRVRGYSLRYAKWIYFSIILLLLLRVVVLEMNLSNQTNRMLIIYLFVFHVMFSFIRTREQFNKLLYVIIICVLINAVETIFASYTGAFKSVEYHNIIRATSYSLNANDAAILIITLIPIMVYIYKLPKVKKIKNVIVGIILLSVLATILTVSRTGFIGLIILAFFYMMKNKRLFIPAALLIIIFSYSYDYLMSSSAYDYLYRYGTVLDPQKSDRIQLWGPYLKIISEHPFAGRMAIHDINYFLDAEEQNIIRVRHSHNAYLSLASTYGIPTAMIFLSPLIMSLYIITKYSRLDNELQNMIFIMVILRFIVFFVNHGYLTFLTFAPPIILFLYINIASYPSWHYATD